MTLFLPLGFLTREVFPPLDRHVDVGGLDLDGVDAPPRPSMSTWPVNRNGWALTITDVSWRNGVVVPNPVAGGAVPLGSGWPVAGAKTSSTGGVCVTGS